MLRGFACCGVSRARRLPLHSEFFLSWDREDDGGDESSGARGAEPEGVIGEEEFVAGDEEDGEGIGSEELGGRGDRG